MAAELWTVARDSEELTLTSFGKGELVKSLTPAIKGDPASNVPISGHHYSAGFNEFCRAREVYPESPTEWPFSHTIDLSVSKSVSG